MKLHRALFVIATMVPLVCAAQNPPSAQDQGGTVKSVDAFLDICLLTAPSFSGAQDAARKYEINEIIDLGFMKMGMTKDDSLSVQINDGQKCVITTPPQYSSGLTDRFIRDVSSRLGSPLPQSTPFVVAIGTTSFIIQHDRNGGEAFVMLKQKD